MILLKRILLVALCVMGLSFSVWAQAAGNVAIEVVLPGAIPADELRFTVYNSDGDSLGWGIVSSGSATLPADFEWSSSYFTGDFPVGDYTLELHPSGSYEMTNNGLYFDQSVDFTVSTTGPDYNAGSDTFVVPQMALVKASRWLKITVREGDTPSLGSSGSGTPIPNYYFTAIQHSAPNTQFQVKTNSSGFAYIAVPLNDDNGFNICAPDDPYSSELGCSEIYMKPVYPTSGATQTSIDAVVRVVNSQIVVELWQPGFTAPFVVPQGSFYPTAECQKGYSWFSAALTPGDSSATLDLAGGNYECYAFIADYSTVPASVTLGSNDTQTVKIPVFSKNSKIKLRAVKEDGSLIT
ncbi:MAG: hypothetical protein KDD62_13600, partial [Bdellovibrionales bacterium]|nr:hypothetical protein [Bdellovibrionales bacterium]